LKVSDVSNGFVISNNGFNRLHMFQSEDRSNLVEAILKYSGDYVGVSLRLRKEPISLDQFWNEKFGKYR
jgi:DnaJ family protein C protein 13